MRVINRWVVDVTVAEEDGRTYAEAELRDDIGDHVIGTGRATLNGDPDVPEYGDEIAVARALAALGHCLLDTAAKDIQAATTAERVPLSR
ncbi:MAG TPA: dsRBD fold-containing protein [Micromonosporaceae bacterium]|jgi:FlaG/FlaF family flagellin (archaellin)|nr:dsRBD fold-containing protein [Micromonosporaceae bacterium]